jgi:hypothetical protein
VTAVTRAIVWTLELSASGAEVEALAREVTGRDGRGAGLLANPHSQEIEWKVASA